MKTSAKMLLLTLTMGVLASLASPVLAYSPFLSASYVGGSSTSLQISVSNANPYSQVNLSSRQSGNLWTQVNNLGQTDGTGYFSQVINLPGDGSSNPLQVYVTVGGQQSSTISVYPGNYNGGGYNGGGYCNGYNCNSGTLSLSQTSLSLSAGQSSTISIYNNNSYNYSNNYYISTNSNSSVASASVSGNSLYISALNSGSTTITVCQNSGTTGCATVYVTVNGYNNGSGNGNVTFNPLNPTMYVGQSLAVAINSSVSNGYNYGYSNNAYYISTNSNPGVVTASIVGTAMNLYANQSGSSSISVCSSGLNFCGTVYVTVNGNGGYNGGGSLSLSQTSLSLNVGQTQTITAYNYNGGSLYVSSNSNSNAVSVTMNGAQLNFYGLNSGSATVSICANSSSSQCASVYVTVGGGYYGGSLTFSPNSVYMNISQSSTVTVSGGGGFYISSNSNPSVVGATITGSTIYLNSLSSGSSTISVCQNLGSNQCGSFYVTVSGYGSGNNSTLWFSQNTVNLNYAQTQNITIYSNSYSGTYYISSNSNPSAVTATVYSNQLSLYGNTNGNSTITVCQNTGSSNCGTVYITVGSGSGGTGCYYNCGGYNGGSISLSQTSLLLNLGQSASVTLYGSGSYYVSTNSNPAVASVTISGSTVNVYAGSSGSTTASICQNTNSGCASLYITVSNGYNGTGGYGNNTVNIGDDFFSPRNITVAAGTTVVWTNTGTMVHTVTADDNSFTSGNINPGQSFSHTFNTAGNFAYHCIFHGGIGGVGMSGVVTVSGSYYGGGSTLGTSTYANGALISENGAVSLIYHNLKTTFASAAAFLGLGYSFNNVVNVGNSGLPSSGYTVTTSHSQHPWGSWIKDGGNTVYFVHQLGLIPVPDWSTFLNNGGQANWIVRANTWDFSLPILSPMTMNDSRLQQ